MTFLVLFPVDKQEENLSRLCVVVKLLGWQAAAVRCILSTLVYTQTAAVSTSWLTYATQAVQILIICRCITER